MSVGYVAPREGVEAADVGTRRLPLWAVTVSASLALLLAAGVAMTVLWFTTSGTRTSAYIAAAEVERIELDIGDGDVTVVGGGLDEVAVHRTDHYAFEQYPSEWRTLQDGVVRIFARCPSLVIGSCAADYHLRIRNGVPLIVRVERGNVRLTGYRGSADLETRAGAITIGGFCGSLLQAATKEGDIRATTSCAADRIELRTDTGDVRATVPRGSYRVDADSNAGRVRVRGISSAFGARRAIQALSNSGDVTVEKAP